MKNILIALIMFTALITGVTIGSTAVMLYVINTQDKAPIYPNGYEILAEVNKYRASEGKKDLVLSPQLCDNLGARWDNYALTDSHNGLQEWADDAHIDYEISEVLATGKTAEETVNKWKGSPGHNLGLLNNTYACAYSSKGISVMILSNHGSN